MRNKLVLILISLNLLILNVTLANFLENEDDGEDRTNTDWIDTLLKYIYRNREKRMEIDDDFENWKGRWMPTRLGEPVAPPKIFPKTENDEIIKYRMQYPHGVPMGESNHKCDDAKTNLTMDWDGSPVNYTCYAPKIIPNKKTIPIQYCEQISRNYVAMHKCMYEKIEYDTDIPLYGTHRPLWPVYGEYKFLPKQRWLHNMEHGAVVMLYHPCANPLEVKKLKTLVTGCLRRHVITPYNLLPEDRPLTLVTWGCQLAMSYVNPSAVRKFIRQHALRGPEQISTDGDFMEGLISQAKIVTDVKDSNLCPK